MKKSKLSKSLVSSFIAVMALSACSSIKAKDGALLTYTGHDGEEYTIVTDKMYETYKSDKSVISDFYDRVLEVLIRDAYASKKFTNVRSYESICNEAKNKVETQQKNAEDSGNYDTEWENILKTNGVEDEEGLKNKFIYELEKEELKDWYFKNYKDTTLTNEFIQKRLPYHIRHVLVKTSETTNFTTDTITKEQAKKLFDTVIAMANGDNTFGDVALKYSEDTSNTNYGDVGIMSTKLSGGSLQMVQEFQLGIYAYDALISKTAPADDAAKAEFNAKKEGLGLAKETATGYEDTEAATAMTAMGLKKVPYDVFKQLDVYKDTTTDATNHIVGTEDQSCVYPRNILWNKYLNIRNPFVITDNKRNVVAVPTTNDGTRSSEDINEVGPIGDDVPTITAEQIGVKSGFAKVADIKAKTGIDLTATLGDDQTKVLVDEKGNVIVGVRSQYGIHFMVIAKSAFDADLDKYYTTYVPGDTNYPKNGEADAVTYVNSWYTKDKTVYTSRAETVKNEIKTFDELYDYRLYKELKDKEADRFNLNGDDNDLIAKIDNYIEVMTAKYSNEQKENFEEIWTTYTDLLGLQEQARLNKDIMVPEGCIVGFKADAQAADFNAYKPGGACYYGNKKA